MMMSKIYLNKISLSEIFLYFAKFFFYFRNMFDFGIHKMNGKYIGRNYNSRNKLKFRLLEISHLTKTP